MKYSKSESQVSKITTKGTRAGRSQRLLFCLAIVYSCGYDVSDAFAATRTWTGVVNSFWSEPGNWTPAGAPQEGDSLFFPASATRYSSQNDLPPPVRLTRIELAGGGYTLTGTNVILDADFTDSHSAGNPNELRFTLYFNGAATINVTGVAQGELLEIFGQIRAGGDEDITILVDAGTLTLRDALVGSGAVIKRGNGVLYFRSGNPNIYYDGMHVLEGTVHLMGNKPVYADTGTGRLTVGSNGVSQATVYVGPTPWAGQVRVAVNDSHLQFDHPTGVHFLSLREGAVVDGNGSLTVYGSIESISDVLTPVIKLPLDIFPPSTGFNIHGANYSGIDIQTPIGGPGGILKLGDSALVLKHNNSFMGSISVGAGILDASGANALGLGTNVVVYNRGSLTLRNIAVTGKTLDAWSNEQLAPGLTGTKLTVIGTASWNGPVVLRTNVIVLGGDVDFTGPISGSGGMIFLNGASTLEGADANTFTGPTIARGSLLQFNKPPGIRAFSNPLQVGGPFGGPFEVRWLQDYQNLYAEVTLSANGLINLNGHWDDFGPITFNGGTIATGAGELGLYGLVTVNPSAHEAVVNGRVGLPPGAHEFRVGDGPLLADLKINATVVGSGYLRKTGLGQMWLNASNTYAGVTLVEQGSLVAFNASALGSPSLGTIISEGASLILNASGSTVWEQITMAGSGDGFHGTLNVFGSVTLRNPFPGFGPSLDISSNAVIRVEADSVFTADGVVSGTGPLTKTGPGTLTFANASPNTYSGDTFVTEGVLNLSKPNFAVSVPGNLIVGPAPLNSSAIARWSTSGGMNPSAIATINARSLLDLNGNGLSLSRLNLNDGGDAQTGAGRLDFPFLGMVAVGSLSQLGSHSGSTFSGNIGLPANATLTFAVNGYAPTAPFDFNPELNVSATIVAPPENPNFERAGIAKTGAGTLRLSGASSFNGRSDVMEGSLIAANSLALGSPFDGTFVFNNAKLALEGSLTIENEILVLNSAATPALESLSSESYWGGQVILNQHSTVGARADSLLQLAGVISGAANFTKVGAGILRFGGGNHNTYSGETFINEGTLLLSKPLAVTAVPGPLSIGTPAGVPATVANLTSYQVVGNIFVNRGGLLNVNGQVENVDHLWLSEGGDVQTGGGVLSLKTGGSIQVLPGAVNESSTISGNLEMLAGAHNLNVAASTGPASEPDLDITALISSSGGSVSLQKNGTGKLRLSANNTYASTFVNAGSLQVDGSQPTSGVVVAGGAALIGKGSVGSVALLSPSAVVAPGASPGRLQVRDFNLYGMSGGTLNIELSGTAAVTQYDQLTVQGIVDLNTLTLQAIANFAPTIGDQFMIVNNDLIDPVEGTFNGLPQGATVTLGDHIFQIDYSGGDGNDVVLTKIGEVYRPILTIERLSAGMVRLLWPTNDPAFILQFTTNAMGPNLTGWGPVSESPVVSGTNRVITNTTVNSQTFYRLAKP